MTWLPTWLGNAADAHDKFTYASEFLAILSMTLSKAAVVVLLERLNINGNKTWPFLTLMSSVGVWGLLLVFIVAFQCRLPEPWRFSQSNCPTDGKLYFIVGSFNILTDAILSVCIIPRIRTLNMAWSLRLTIMTLFAFRLS
jgi:hypothetical protein